MKLPETTKKQRAILLSGCAAGLFASHALSELVPDALGIGVGMFAAGALSGFIVGVVWRNAVR
jgi:membrane associated rhomboid family serine protease